MLLVNLLVLSELFLKLEELSLEGGLLEVGGFLIGVDYLLRNELVECLCAVLGYEVVDFSSIGLEGTVSGDDRSGFGGR